MEDRESNVGQSAAKKRNNIRCAKSGEYDEDITQNDVNYPALALESAPLGAGEWGHLPG